MKNMRNEFGVEPRSKEIKNPRGKNVIMHQAKAQGSAIHPSFKGRFHVEYNSGEVKRKPTNGAFGKPKKKQINT